MFFGIVLVLVKDVYYVGDGLENDLPFQPIIICLITSFNKQAIDP